MVFVFGSVGMEICLVNFFELGDEVVICIYGVFGGRMMDIVEWCGVMVMKVEVFWGEFIDF